MQSAGTNEDSSEAEEDIDSADESQAPAPSGDTSNSPPVPIDAAESESDVEETTDEISQSSTHGGNSVPLHGSPKSNSRQQVESD